MQARVRDSEDLSNQLRALGNVNPENLTTRHWKQMQYGFTALAEYVVFKYKETVFN